MRGLARILLIVLTTIPGAPASAQDWSTAQSVRMELSSFKFTPADLRLKRGAPYNIHFFNSASGGHDFVAKEFFDEATIAPEDKSKLRNGGIDLEGGESVDIKLIANRPGVYKSRCTHFMHSMMGMTGTVTVD
jgi:plastocyanin